MINKKTSVSQKDLKGPGRLLGKPSLYSVIDIMCARHHLQHLWENREVYCPFKCGWGPWESEWNTPRP